MQAISRNASLAMARVTRRPCVKASLSSVATICPRGSQRTLDSQRNVGNHMGLDLKLAIAEQLEENRLGQFDIRGGKPHHRRQSKSRQQVGSVESPGVRRCATGQQQPHVVLERHIHEVKKQRFRLRGAICILEQYRMRASADLDARSFNASPWSVIAPEARAQIAPRWLFPAPSGPTRVNIRPAQFGQSSIALKASRFDGAERKSSRAKLGECRQRKVSWRGGEIIGRPAPSGLDRAGSSGRAR